jgi:2-dehydro-3-deoxygalactonokinase
MRAPDWIAVDWGTSNVRAWGLTSDGSVICEASSGKGMSKLKPAEFEPALLELIGKWLPQGRITSVLACGMVGARQGWMEAPYRPAPCAPVRADETVHPPTDDARLNIAILPGVSQMQPHADVMRGEETQIAGFLSERPHFDGVVCLPGTHTKWVRVCAGEIVRFQTFMTGELFDLLSTHSVLRHSVDTMSWDDREFEEAVTSAAVCPQGMAARLFEIRADTLLSSLAAGAAKARLSAALIGAELAAASEYLGDEEVAIIGGPFQAELYATALSALGKRSTSADATHVTLAGLKSAYLQTGENRR